MINLAIIRGIYIEGEGLYVSSQVLISQFEYLLMDTSKDGTFIKRENKERNFPTQHEHVAFLLYWAWRYSIYSRSKNPNKAYKSYDLLCSYPHLQGLRRMLSQDRAITFHSERQCLWCFLIGVVVGYNLLSRV